MEWVKLGNLVNIKTGKLNANAANPKGKYPFFTTAKEISYIDSYSYDDEVVLVAGNGDLNVKYYEGKFDAYQRTYILTKKENSEINLKFLYFFMSDYVKILRNQSIGGVIKYIKLENLTEAKIPLLSLSEQINIVDLLNNAERLIEIRNKQIQAYDNLIESLFFEMFGNPNYEYNRFNMTKLGDLGTWKSGGTPKRSNKNYFTGDIPWVTSGELNDIFIHDSFEHINEEAIENSSTKLVPIGSLLLGMYDSAGLKSSISSKVLTTNQAIAFSKLDDDICNTIFVYFCIQLMRDKLLKKQRGVRQKNFNLSMIKEISIPIPPIEMQNKFADYVVKLEEEKKKLRASLDELEILFDALMEDAFSGNLFKE